LNFHIGNFLIVLFWPRFIALPMLVIPRQLEIHARTLSNSNSERPLALLLLIKRTPFANPLTGDAAASHGLALRSERGSMNRSNVEIQDRSRHS
jgi:hypothetical protein